MFGTVDYFQAEVREIPYGSFKNCVYFWLPWVFVAAHGLSLAVVIRGCSLVVVCMLLIAVASPVAEHRL